MNAGIAAGFAGGPKRGETTALPARGAGDIPPFCIYSDFDGEIFA